MQISSRLISAVFVFLLGCAVLQAAPYDAIVTATRGNVLELDQQGQVVRTLSVNASVPEGHGIQVQNGGVATIILANGGVLTIRPGTTIQLEQMQLDGHPTAASYTPLKPAAAGTRTRIHVSRGEVLGEIKGIRANSKFEVTSAVGTAGITGTKFVISVVVIDGNYTMTISNLDGSVLATYQGEAPFPVPAGSSVELSATYDSATETVEEVSSTSSSIPPAALQQFAAEIDEAVGEIEASDEVDLPEDLIPLPNDPLDPENPDNGGEVIEVGSPI